MYLHEELTERIIGCAMNVHRALGPGLSENTYEEALCIDLAEGGLEFSRQRRIPVLYKERLIGEYRPDLIVSDLVVIEIKSVERFIGLHRAQLLAYLRVSNTRVGLLLNFNCEVMKDGIRRVVL